MPGNLAELRPLIVICGFVGLFCLLVGFAVSETPTFFSGGQTSGTSPISSETVPNPLGIIAWNETLDIQLGIYSSENFAYSGYNCRIYEPNLPWQDKFQSVTYAGWWIFEWDIEDFNWYSLDNVKESVYDPVTNAEVMHLSTMDADYTSGNLSALQYQWRNTKVKIDTIFTFNTTAYTSPTDAYTHDEFYLVLNANWAERPSSMNALSFIAGLFLFSLPGVPVIVNSIIWIMIFPALAYLAFIVVLKIIGSIFGGG